MMEVQPDRVTVLADTSVRAHDLDEAKAMEAERLPRKRSPTAPARSTTRRRSRARAGRGADRRASPQAPPAEAAIEVISSLVTVAH